jgi:hypothetical protein
MEDFPEMIAEQESLQRRLRDPFGNQIPNSLGGLPKTLPQVGFSPFISANPSPKPPSPFSGFHNGVPTR